MCGELEDTCLPRLAAPIKPNSVGPLEVLIMSQVENSNMQDLQPRAVFQTSCTDGNCPDNLVGENSSDAEGSST